MSDTDRSPHQASDAVSCSQSRPESCVKLQSKIMCKTQHKLHPLPLHPAVRTSAMVLIVTCAVVGYGSCSSWSTVRPSDVAPNSFGTFNFQELEEVVYDIEILKVPVPEPPPHVDLVIDSTLDSKDSGGVADGDAEQTVVDLPPSVGTESDERSEKTMEEDNSGITHSEDDTEKNQHLVLLSKYGQKYLCNLPKDISVQVGSNGSDLGNETKSNTFNVSALLHPLTKQPCLTRNTGWWTYEYCHGDYIRQYHSEAAKTVKNLWIGYYRNETVWSQEEIRKAKERIESLRGKLSNFQVYHSVDYVNGTTCDLTGKPRRATVKIFCSLSGEERLVSVEERETCDYVLHVETPLLCRQRLFRVTSLKKPRSLSCSPLVSQEEFQEYTEKQERLRMEEEEMLKEKQEKIAARKKKGAGSSGSKPARKKHVAISDLLDPEADLDEEKIVARKTVDGRGGLKLNVGSSKSKSKSGLFDSGTEDQEVIDKQELGDEMIEDDEELQKMADRFGKAVLEDLMKGLSSQMSNWAKDKESPLRNAWERAIKKTQRTVDKLAEIKENGEKRFRPDKTSKLAEKKTEKKEHISLQEAKDSPNKGAKYQEQDQKSSPTGGAAVDKNKNIPSGEEETQSLRDMIQRLKELNQESLKRRLQVERELNREGLYVDDDDDEEEEEEEEEDGVKDRQILRGEMQHLKKLDQRVLKKKLEVDKEMDTGDLSIEEQEGEEGDEGEAEEEDELNEESLEQLGEDITEEIQKQLEDIGLGSNADIKVKVFTLPYDKLHNFIDDENDEENYLDDEDDEFDGEHGDGGELDAYGNPKETTADSASSSSSSSHPDKDLPAGSRVALGGGSRGSSSSKSGRRKGKRENSEVKVFHLKLESLFGQSEGDEEKGGVESSSKSSRGTALFSSLIEQLMSPMTEERKKVNELESNYEQVWEDIDEEETE